MLRQRVAQTMLGRKGAEWLPGLPRGAARLSHMAFSVVSTKARRAARRDLFSTIGRLSLREGLSAPRFALRSRRRAVPDDNPPGFRPCAKGLLHSRHKSVESGSWAMGKTRKMRLVAFLKTGPTAHHHGMWRHPETDNDFLDPAWYEHVARVLEKGKFDCLFF